MQDALNIMESTKKQILVLDTRKIAKAPISRYTPLATIILEKAIPNLLQRIQSPDTKYPMEKNVDGYVSTNNNIQNLLGWDINLFKDLSRLSR